MRKRYLGMAISITMMCVFASSAFGTTYYVDSSVASSGNGLSWATAWKGFSNITGLQPGDTVYFSGGSTSQAYAVTNWTPTGGTSGNPITYAVGQDPGHNGVVTITSSDSFLSGVLHDITINGNVGGAQHWSVTPVNFIWYVSGGTSQNVTIRYITVPNMGSGFHWNSSSTNVEVDHCNLVKNTNSSNDEDFIFEGGDGTAPHALKVHDNYIKYPYRPADDSFGDDMWRWGQNFDFYNNTVQGFPLATYTWSQHSDGFQLGGEHNVYIWNNTFIDTGESTFYEDSHANTDTVSNVWFYNNTITRSFPCPAGGAQRIFDLNPELGAAGITPYTDIVFANNTVVDQVGNCTFFARVSGAGSYTRVYVVNNIQYPSDSGISFDAGVTVSNNYAGNGIQFVKYSQYGGGSNDFHIVGSDTAVINQGRNMSTYFSVDRDGKTRPQGSAWDIGEYQFGGSAQLAPPTGLSATVN